MQPQSTSIVILLAAVVATYMQLAAAAMAIIVTLHQMLGDEEDIDTRATLLHTQPHVHTTTVAALPVQALMPTLCVKNWQHMLQGKCNCYRCLLDFQCSCIKGA